MYPYVLLSIKLLGVHMSLMFFCLKKNNPRRAYVSYVLMSIKNILSKK